MCIRDRNEDLRGHGLDDGQDEVAAVAGGGDVEEGQLVGALLVVARGDLHRVASCLLYTSDAADERSSVDLGGRRIIKKKKTENHNLTARETCKKRPTNDT